MHMNRPVACAALLLVVASALSQGTAFTYQGRLSDGSAAAHGRYDLRFAVYDAPTGGAGCGDPLTNAATPVSNGCFTVTLDFGAAVFTGDARWLDLAVRTNGAVNFQPLAPRQPLTPTPYALFTARAGSATYAATATNLINPPANQLTNGQSGVTFPLLSATGSTSTQYITIAGSRIANSTGFPVSGLSGSAGNGLYTFAGYLTNAPNEEGGYYWTNSAGSCLWHAVDPYGNDQWLLGTSNEVRESAGPFYTPGAQLAHWQNAYADPASQVPAFSEYGVPSLQAGSVVAATVAGDGRGLYGLNVAGSGGYVSNSAATLGSLVVTGALQGTAARLTDLPFNRDYLSRFKVPMLEWNGWFQFGTNSNLGILKSNITYMVANGLVAAGWNMVALDGGMTRDYTLDPDPVKFPHGWSEFTSFAHANGMLAGYYVSVATYPHGDCIGAASLLLDKATCEAQMAYVQGQGFDKIKIDLCLEDSSPQVMQDMFNVMGNALLHSANSYGTVMGQVVTAYTYTGHHSSTPLAANWNCWEDANSWQLYEATTGTVTNLMALFLADYRMGWFNGIGPGHFAELQGFCPMNTNQTCGHLGLSAVVSSPVLNGYGFPAWSLRFCTNQVWRGILQDPAVNMFGVQTNGVLTAVWKPLGLGNPHLSNAVFLANSGGEAKPVTFAFTNLGWTATQPVSVLDVWSGTDVGTFLDSFTQTVPANSSGLYVLTTPGSYAGRFTGDGGGLTNLSVRLPDGLITNRQAGVTLSGTFSGNLAAASVTGALTTNISVGSYTLYITNGLIWRVSSP